MLITKEVEIGLNSTNIAYYENKCYEIPRYINKYGKVKVKRGTKIKVKTEDLPLKSNIYIYIYIYILS